MINRQNIWFTFLCSIILVLSIVYVSMNPESISNFEISDDYDDTEFVISNDTELVALRIQNDEENMEIIQELRNTILDLQTDAQKKNEAFEQLQAISNNKILENKIEHLIKDTFSYDSFVKITGDNIRIVVQSESNDYQLANNIIRKVNESIPNKYITVKFH